MQPRGRQRPVAEATLSSWSISVLWHIQSWRHGWMPGFTCTGGLHRMLTWLWSLWMLRLSCSAAVPRQGLWAARPAQFCVRGESLAISWPRYRGAQRSHLIRTLLLQKVCKQTWFACVGELCKWATQLQPRLEGKKENPHGVLQEVMNTWWLPYI